MSPTIARSVNRSSYYLVLKFKLITGSQTMASSSLSMMSNEFVNFLGTGSAAVLGMILYMIFFQPSAVGLSSHLTDYCVIARENCRRFSEMGQLRDLATNDAHHLHQERF